MATSSAINNEPVASGAKVDMKFEVIVIPVADVDRSKAVLLKAWVEARCRFLIRQWIPYRPIHASRVGVLGSIRHEDNDGRAGLRPGSLPDRFRYRSCPQRSRCAQCRG